MKTLVVSDQYGIFCGMSGNYACFSKDPILAGPRAYAFETKERAQEFVKKMPTTYQDLMDFKPINTKDTFVSLQTLIREGFGDKTGHMLDVLVSDTDTMH